MKRSPGIESPVLGGLHTTLRRVQVDVKKRAAWLIATGDLELEGTNGIGGTITAHSLLPGDREFRTDGPVTIRMNGCYTKLGPRSHASGEQNRPVPGCKMPT